MGIEDADYIFSVRGNDLSEQNLAKLASTLQDNGFQVQARPGTGLSKLLFAKLSSKTYAEIVVSDLARSSIYGPTTRVNVPLDRPMLIYSYITSPRSTTQQKGVGIMPGKGDWAFIESLLPNTGVLRDKRVADLSQKQAFSPSLSTTGISNTHGNEVALYFEFLRFYILALGVLSIFGVVAYIKSRTYSLTYSFVSLVWAVTFLLLWKRKERALANLWGVQNTHKLEKLDAGFGGESLGSAGTVKGSRNGTIGWYRFLREWAFLPVALLFAAVLVIYQLTCFMLEILLSEIYNGPGKVVLKLIPTVLITVFVPILTFVYNLVVEKFLAWEGHTNDYTRSDSFVVKTFALNFLTGYVPLLITSFIYLPFAHFIQPELPVLQNLVVSNIHHDRYAYRYLSQIKTQSEFKINQGRLDNQFFYFVVTNQIIQFVLRYALPLLVPRIVELVQTMILGKKHAPVPVDAPKEKKWLSAVRKYTKLPQYNVHNDYRGLCLQFGYLVMFGPVWTLAPLMSLVFNVIVFKLDTLKLTNGKYFRPPIPKRAGSIHPWDMAFFSLAWLGSMVSPAVAAFYRHGTTPPKTLGQFAMDKASVNVSSSTQLWLTLFASEHLFFFLLFVGSKATSFWQSDHEVENRRAQLKSGSENIQFHSDDIISGDKSDDWDVVSLEELQKQAHGVGKTEESEKVVSNSAVFSSKNENDSTVTRRRSKLDELQKKKAQLSRVKETLKNRQLKAGRESENRIIETIESNGHKTPAIIDGNSHVSEKDTEDIDRILTANEKKSSDETEEDSDSSAFISHSRSNSPEEKSKSRSSKFSRRKSLKKFLKRG